MLVKASLIGGASAALFLAPNLVEDLARGASEGEERTRSIEASREMTIVDMLIAMDGQEIPADQMGDIETTSFDSYSATLHDVFGAANGTRATRFTRTYRALSGASSVEGGALAMMGSDDLSSDLVSELEGEDVIFTWDGEAEEYTATLPEESTLDEDLLEDLEGDLEFAGLLPRRAVEVDEIWDIDLDVFESIIEPGGELHLMPSDADMEEFGEMEEQIEDADVEPEYDGTFTGKLLSVAERKATIEIRADIEMLMDLSGVLDPMTQEMQGMEILITPIEMVIERTAEGTGTLVWDLEKGRLVSFTFEADVSEISSNTMEMEVMDQVIEQFQELTQEGTIELSYTVE